MLDYDNQGGGERFPVCARLRNTHKSYIFPMAQIQGAKIYEAPRRRLSYFVLWHRPTKIDAMFQVATKPLACSHVDADSTHLSSGKQTHLSWNWRSAKVDQTTLEQIVAHKWSSGRRPGRGCRSAAAHPMWRWGSARASSLPLSSCKLPQTKLKSCVVTAELQTGCNQTPLASGGVPK